jgi:hypothetical protein
MGPLEAQPLTRELITSARSHLETPARRREPDEEPEAEFLLTVRWGHNDDQIISVFREWLLRSRPSEYPNWKDKGGRTNRVQDELNHLAAYRFEKHGLREKAVKLGFTLYPHESTWKNAVEKAWSRIRDRR